jgi:hypothetical protein
MKTYMIGYDLNKTGQDYASLIQEIKEIANGYWHHLDSTWLVNSNLGASNIIDRLVPHVDANDEILVIAVADDWASYGIRKSGTDWLKESLRPACTV